MLLQLGDQLIRSESIAVLELVKNSYDANANLVTLRMNDLTTPKTGKIEIEDDGDGMSLNTIRDVWMYPGTEDKNKKAAQITDDSKRMPIGGKGIGRFGVHKLGFEITLITKAEGHEEVELSIDWRDFERDALLNDIPIKIYKHSKPRHFKNGKTGTILKVTNLRSKWTRGSVRELYRAVTSLSSPFQKLDKFETVFDLDKYHWLDGLTKFSEMKKLALYYSKAIISGAELKELNYEFRPWDSMDKLSKRPYKSDAPQRLVETIIDETTGKKKLITLDLDNYEIGEVTLELLIFDLSPKVLALGMTESKGFKDYLKRNGGIRVFRNGIRVYDYGEPGNDWLNLDKTRVNRPGKTISNNIVIGAIYLDKKSSSDLEEKTNREGFVENEAYFKFVEAVLFTLDKVLTQRNIDKEQVRKFYSPRSVSQPVMGPLADLQGKIEKKIKKGDLQDSLLKSVKAIKDDFETISEIYTRSASAGLSLSIVIHEIMHMIAELSRAVQIKKADKHIRELVKTLQKTTNNYASVIKRSRKSRTSPIEILEQSLENIEFRIDAHKIDVKGKYKTRSLAKVDLKMATNLMTSSIINIIDNSLWWQNYAKTKNKKLYLDVIDFRPGYTSIIIADNGPGFTIPTIEAVKPFISDKPEGMGLGLHLAHEVMKSHKGHISFPNPQDIELPKPFWGGGCVMLSLPKVK
ncbi:ATP-binding protein [Hellea sp.]|nr:ATP-binding protein [Hellea sp.]